MKVEVDLTEYGVKAPKWYDPINPHVINASGGSGGGNDVELTWEEYEALSEEEKMNGSNYFITDIGNPKSLVKKVLFDDVVSANITYTMSDDILRYDYVVAYVYPSTAVRIANPLYFNNSDLLKIVGNTNNDFLIGFNQSTSSALQVLSIIPTSTTFKPYVIYNVGFQGASAHVVLIGYRYERVVVPNQMVNYSTVEQRIGTWIDGKPLYQKSFTLSSRIYITSSWPVILPASEISDLNIKFVVGGYVYDNNGVGSLDNYSVVYPVPFLVNSSGILTYSPNNYACTALTIQYTKITD